MLILFVDSSGGRARCIINRTAAILGFNISFQRSVVTGWSMLNVSDGKPQAVASRIDQL